MAGPRYTVAQTRARVAALEIAAGHLEECMGLNELDGKQFADVANKLRMEAYRLKLKAQERRNGEQLFRQTIRATSHAEHLLPATPAATEADPLRGLHDHPQHNGGQR